MKYKAITGIMGMLFFASMLALSFDIRLVESDPSTIVMVDYSLTSSSGAYRWMDVANQEYSSDYRNNYNYSQATVTIAYADVGENLNGTLIAENLKPNFAYQLKLVGTPGTAENEHIGLAGRWWQETWNGSTWTDGMNLNDKGNGSSPNPNDETYFARRFVADNSSPTGYYYKYTGYLVFDYFMTDSNGNATLSFQTGSCYHVLWETSQRSRTASDGPLKTVTFDPDPSQTAYDQNYPNSTISIFGEWERLPMGDTNLAIGQYTCQIVLTEESFHGSGPLEGNWATAMTAAITFTINATETYHYSFSRFMSYIISFNDMNPSSLGPFPLICSFNISLDSPDANGVRNLTVPKESYYCEPIYVREANQTLNFELMSDGHGKMYNGTGDVDIISMTNDTGTFFKKDGAWHPAGEEWIGDGNPDSPGSSWSHFEVNISRYEGEGVDGPFWGYKPWSLWYTTGSIENTVETNGPLNGSYISATGVPFSEVGGTVTYVSTGARTNFTLQGSIEDTQYISEIAGGVVPVSSGTLFSPADLYITDPLGWSIGIHPNGTTVISQIPDAFYTGPSSEPERVIIPNPLNGTYEILITGTGNGTFAFMVDFALSSNITERTKDVYYGNIADGGVLWSKVVVSGGNVTSFTPVSTIGDINQDAIVDIVDVVTCAIAFGSKPVDPEWNPLVDLNLDSIIDIVDIVKIAIHFGEHV